MFSVVTDHGVVDIFDRAKHGALVIRLGSIGACFAGMQIGSNTFHVQAIPGNAWPERESTRSRAAEIIALSGQKAHETTKRNMRKEIRLGDTDPCSRRRILAFGDTHI